MTVNDFVLKMGNIEDKKIIKDLQVSLFTWNQIETMRMELLGYDNAT